MIPDILLVGGYNDTAHVSSLQMSYYSATATEWLIHIPWRATHAIIVGILHNFQKQCLYPPKNIHKNPKYVLPVRKPPISREPCSFPKLSHCASHEQHNPPRGKPPLIITPRSERKRQLGFSRTRGVIFSQLGLHRCARPWVRAGLAQNALSPRATRYGARRSRGHFSDA